MHFVKSSIVPVAFSLFVLFYASSEILHADNLENQEEALRIISDFADRFCKTIPLEGSKANVELSGNAKVELDNLIKQIGELGIEGAAKYQSSEWQGVLQENLAEALKDNIQCRTLIWKDLSDRLIISPSQAAARQGWDKVKIIERMIAEDIKYPHIEGLSNYRMEPKINSYLKRRVMSFYREMKEEGYSDLRVWYDVAYQEYNLLGLLFYLSMYGEGAAHPQTFTEALSIDLETGEFFEFKDIFKPGFKNKLNLLITDFLKKENQYFSCEGRLLSKACFDGIKDSQFFYITDIAVVCVFGPREVAPSFEGDIKVPLYFDHIIDIVNPKGPLRKFFFF